MDNKELNIIKQAIINEIECYEFYKLAAEQAPTKEGREAFLVLAEEELKHSKYLKELFDNIKDKNDDFKLAFLNNPPSPNIFDWDNIKTKSSSLSVTVFGIGVQMEKDSIEFYENAKKGTEYNEAKKLYDILIAWEKVHLDQFMKQYNKHKDQWWFEQGYAPF